MSKPFTPFPNGGKLMKRKNVTGKQPQYSGDLCIGEDIADYIQQELRAGRDILLSLSGWKKTSQAGNDYLSLAVQKPFIKDGAAPGKVAKKASVDEDDSIPF